MAIPLNLLNEIRTAHEQAALARETLQDVLNEINPNHVELMQCHEGASEAEGAVDTAIQDGRIPIHTMHALIEQETDLPVSITNRMNHIAARYDEIGDIIQEAVYAPTKDLMIVELNNVLEAVQDIEHTWADIIQIAEESNEINESSNNESSNNDSFGGRRKKKRTLRKHRKQPRSLRKKQTSRRKRKQSRRK
jgi:hypothetical protein